MAVKCKKPETKYIAAIDFGTAYTGLAFANRKPDNCKISSDDIKVKNNWPGEQKRPRKVPTSVLFDKDGIVIAYGYQAETLVIEEEDSSHALFRHFKMSLHSHNMKFNPDMVLTSLDGRTRKTAMEVVSKSLQFLGLQVIDFIELREGHCPKKEEITWVITVPAIWNISIRQFMRKAVKKAGLCEENYGNLVIGLEPECAALYLELKNKDMRRGRYAIVDCGGGTVDVSYHQCQSFGQSSYTIDELKASTGKPKGGTLADRKFEALMDRVFGRGTIEKLKQENSSSYLQLMHNFEKKKPSINLGAAQNIPKFKEGLNPVRGHVAGVTVKTTIIKIENDTFSSLFEEPVDWICRHLAENLKTLANVKRLYFTGGFSMCKLLQDRVKELDAEVINPDEEDLAVVMGAVIYGSNPRIVRSRVMGMTYGVQISNKYDPEEHKGRGTAVIKGDTYCDVVFSPLIKKGDTITDEDERVCTYNPVYADQDAIRFPIYASLEQNVQFTDDSGCEEIGSMTLQMPDTTGGTEREAKVYTSFTGKELHTRARSERDNTEINCVLNIY